MPRKCSVAFCRTNYDPTHDISNSNSEKIPVYKFPSDPDVLEKWLAVLPNFIHKDKVTKNMGICRRHWPVQTNMVKRFGHDIPADPPSVFGDMCPNSFLRQTVSVHSRNINERGISSESRRSTEPDPMDEFEQRDMLPTTFTDFVETLYTRREISNFSLHVIKSEGAVHLMSFDNQFSFIESCLSVREDYSVSLRRKGVDISLHNFRDVLGFQCKINRWTQLEAMLVRLKNYDVPLHDELLHITKQLERSIDQNDNATSSKMLFLLEQLSLSFTPSNGRRYSAFTMKTALRLYIASKSSYRLLRTFLVLPHPNTLTSNLGNICDTGSAAYANSISKQVFDSLDGISKKCMILFDEIYVYPSARCRSGHVIGFSIDDPEKPARTVLVFMVRSLFKKVSFVVRFVPVFSLTGKLLLNYLLQVVRIVENSGGRTDVIMSDNLSVNRKLHDLLRSQFPMDCTYAIVHPVDTERKLHLLFDPVHLLKCLRNNWETEKTRRIMFSLPGEMNIRIAYWSDLIDVFEKEKDSPIRRTTLTYQALHPSAIDKQKVSLALQVFHEKTVAALIQDGFSDTAAFVDHILRLWKILNNKSSDAYIKLHDKDRKPISSIEDPSLQFLQEMAIRFCTMSPNKPQVSAGAPKQTRRVMTLTKETSSSVVQTLYGLVDLCKDLLKDNAVRYILLGRIQSDALEGEFGIYRGLFGGLYHITVEQLMIAGKLRRLELVLDLELEEGSSSKEHTNTCCVLELSDEQWETIDTLFNHVSCLNDNERQTIFYIAGYIYKKENMKNTADQTTAELELSDCEFLSLVSRGKLSFPSEELFNFSLLCYAFFKKFEHRCKTFLVRIFLIIFESYFFEFAFPEKSVSRLANTFMKGLVRKHNDSFAIASNDRKRKKLSHS